ncbi:MAG TPA: type I 3-dehydroquinate dehydratase, partial [Gemmataceae bacterium]|nr:type I 3-dehydroquinate dehydratase [Gemmataceae bacterium]
MAEGKAAQPAARSFERLCVVIGRTRHKMVQIEIQEAAKRGARLIELRLDFLAKAPDFKRLLHNKPCPMIATVRRPADGGRWPGTEEARQTLLRQAIVAGFDWVDLETDVADSIGRFKNVKRIISYHNMRETPADIEKIHARMCHQDGDVIKVAVRAQQPSDNLRLLELARRSKKPTVAVCLGDFGMPSRVLGGKYGSPFTYCAFNKERGIAPGLPSFDDMRLIYHSDLVNADTAVYGVIGDPVGHSLSPLVHNTAYRKLGLNAVYVPFRVPRESFSGFLADFDAVPVSGYSVTIPHKETAATVATLKDPNVELTQAANTLLRHAEGNPTQWSAFNTDYTAAVDSLRDALGNAPEGMPTTLQSRVTLILGAGGVARSIAHALHREGTLLTISSRTAERSRKLAEEVDCRLIDWAARHSVNAEVVINCTPVGMHPKVDESPLHPSFLRPGLVVFDTVYTPEQTLLVKEARNRACLVVTGVDFFVRQASQQFRLFTGEEPP